MLIIAAALLALPAPRPLPLAAKVEATVSIRILSGVRLRVGADHSDEGEPVHDAAIRAPDGGRLPARLVEFE